MGNCIVHTGNTKQPPITITDIQKTTKIKYEEKERQRLRDIEIRIKLIYSTTIKNINRSIIESSNEGVWFKKVFVHQTVMKKVYNYYIRKKFRIRKCKDDYRYNTIIEWNIPNPENIKKFKKIVYAIIFIKRLQSSVKNKVVYNTTNQYNGKLTFKQPTLTVTEPMGYTDYIISILTGYFYPTESI